MKEYLEILKKYNTPLYVYKLEKAKMQIKLLHDAIPSKIKIYLSIKANPRKEIIEELIKMLDGVEVASGGELELALNSGVKKRQIIFVGPGKTNKELKVAIDSDIKLIVVESLEEIERINSICLSKNCKRDIAIRINPKCSNVSSRIKMGGTASQFGIDEEKVESIIKDIYRYKGVVLKGVHFYFGSQILDANLLVSNIEYVFSYCEDVINRTGIRFEFIDFGGGFGIPYFIGEQAIDLYVLKSKLQNLFKNKKNKECFRDTEFIVESGRYLLANCGVYIVRVEYIKESRGKKFVIVDGGLNHHSTAVGVGTVLRGNFDIKCINKASSDSNNMEEVTIVGPLCTPTDVIARGILLPNLTEGDYLMIMNSGAYGVTASPINFLSHEKPREILINDNKIYAISEEDKI